MYDETRPPPPLGYPDKTRRNWSMIAHLCGLAFLTVPFGNVVGPLLIWQIKREELGEFVASNAREALNFQFTFVVVIAFFASMNILPAVGGIGTFSLLMIAAVSLANVYFCCIAAIEVNKGEVYRYPYALRPF